MTTAVSHPVIIKRTESSNDALQLGNAATSVELAVTFDEILALRSEWNKLREKSTIISPNADIDRFLTTAKALNENVKPYVALLRIDGKARSLILGRWQLRSGGFRIGYLHVPSPLLKSLDIVYG